MTTQFNCGAGSLCLFGNCTVDDALFSTGTAAVGNLTAPRLMCECDEGFKHDRFGLYYRDCAAPWWADIMFYGAIIIPAAMGLLLTSFHLIRSICARPPLTAYRQHQSFVGGMTNAPGKRHRNRFLILIFVVCLANLAFACAHMYEGRMGPVAVVMHVVAQVVFFVAAFFILFIFRNLLIRLTKRTGRSSFFGLTAAGVPLFCCLAIVVLCSAAAHSVPDDDYDDEAVLVFNTLYGSALSVLAVNSVTVGFLLLRELAGLRTFMLGWLAAFQEEITSRRSTTQDVRDRSQSAVSQTRTYTYTETRTHSHRSISRSFTQFDPSTFESPSNVTPPSTLRTISSLTAFSSAATKPNSPPTLPRRPRPTSQNIKSNNDRKSSSTSLSKKDNKHSIIISSSGSQSSGAPAIDDDGNDGTLVVRKSADVNSVSSCVKFAHNKRDNSSGLSLKWDNSSIRRTRSTSGTSEQYGDGTLVVRKSADVDSVTSWDKPADMYPDSTDKVDDEVYSAGGAGGQYNTVVIRKATKSDRGSGQSTASYNGPSLAMFGLSDNEDEGDREAVEAEDTDEDEALKREREDKLPDFNTFLASGAGGGAGKDGRNIAADMAQEPQEMDFLQLAYLQKFADRVNFFKGSLQVVLVITFVSQASIMIAHFLIGFPMFWVAYTAYWFTFSILWVPMYRLHKAMNSTQMKSKGRRMHTKFERASRQPITETT